jgi:hypothetical protein
VVVSATLWHDYHSGKAGNQTSLGAPRCGTLAITWTYRHGLAGQPEYPYSERLPTAPPVADRAARPTRAGVHARIRSGVKPHRVAVALIPASRHDDHTGETLPTLLEDADRWAATISPTHILRQLGSPFAAERTRSDCGLRGSGGAASGGFSPKAAYTAPLVSTSGSR